MITPHSASITAIFPRPPAVSKLRHTKFYPPHAGRTTTRSEAQGSLPVPEGMPFGKGMAKAHSEIQTTTPDNITNSLLSCHGRINLENIKNNKTRRVGFLLSTSDFAFVIDEPTKNRYYRLIKRMWRNWQTHRLQVPAGLGPWRFDSSHPHYLAIILAGSPH
jgi:hypothetical protein